MGHSAFTQFLGVCAAQCLLVRSTKILLHFQTTVFRGMFFKLQNGTQRWIEKNSVDYYELFSLSAREQNRIKDTTMLLYSYAQYYSIKL